MAPLAKLKPLALDSNLPLDLAADLDAAHTFREIFPGARLQALCSPNCGNRTRAASGGRERY